MDGAISMFNPLLVSSPMWRGYPPDLLLGLTTPILLQSTNPARSIEHGGPITNSFAMNDPAQRCACQNPTFYFANNLEKYDYEIY